MNILRRVHGRVGACSRQYPRELLAAISGGQVRCATHSAIERGCDHGDAAISGGVAVGVVELLEEIELEHDHRKLVAGAREPCRFGFERLFEAMTIAWSGQCASHSKLSEPVAQLFHSDMIAAPCTQRKLLDRLGYVVDCTKCQAAGLSLLIVETGREYDWRVGQQPILLKCAVRFITVDFRHHHVRQDQVGQYRTRQRDRLFAGHGKANLAGVFERRIHDLDLRVFVVDNQYHGAFGYVKDPVERAEARSAAASSKSSGA